MPGPADDARHAKLFHVTPILRRLPHWTAALGAMFLLILGPADAGEPPLLLFGTEESMNLRLVAPFTQIMRDRSEQTYFDAMLSYTDASGAEHRIPLRIRTRGEFRRRKEICDFAPLRLNFRKGDVKGSEFAGQDKIKLVTHCRSGRGSYEQYVLKEYFAYRVLETLTEHSFNTRLISLTYVDTDMKNRERTKYAFLIEEKMHVGERLGWEEMKVSRIVASQLDPAQANLIAVFEYFIGNTDFSMVLGARDEPCCHNIVLYSTEPGVFLPVPYDFDLAGIVNTPYAAPNPKYKLDSVTERLYRGSCANNDLLQTTLARFRDNEEELRELLANLEGLSRYRKREVRRYIDKFYEDFEDERELDRNFLSDCT